MQQVVQEGGGEEYAQKCQHQPGERHQLGHVGVVEHLSAAGPDLLVDGNDDVATIERQHGEEVEDPEEQVDRDEEDQRVPDARLHGLPTAPMIDSTRVPLADAWPAALALATWWNRAEIPDGEKRPATPATVAQVKWPRSDRKSVV